jgi:MFS family permease
MNSQRLTKISLRAFIASVVVAAVMGIVAISIPTRNWDFEFKVFATTLIIAGASVCGLACGGCLTRGHRVLPSAGLGLTAISAVLLLIAAWAEPGGWWFWTTTFVASIYAVACAHLSMLFMAKLARGYRWAYIVAYQLILGLATLLSAGFLFNLFDRPGDDLWRLTGVLAILAGAISLLIPVFHYMSREQFAAEAAATDPVFAIDEEIARAKKRLIELENKRRMLLGRPVETIVAEPILRSELRG